MAGMQKSGDAVPAWEIFEDFRILRSRDAEDAPSAERAETHV